MRKEEKERGEDDLKPFYTNRIKSALYTVKIWAVSANNEVEFAEKRDTFEHITTYKSYWGLVLLGNFPSTAAEVHTD